MNAGLFERVEINVERAAAALFAASVGYAVYEVLGTGLREPLLAACTAGAAIVALLLCTRALEGVGQSPRSLRIPVFDLREVDWPEPAEELVLTDNERVESDELLLTDADRLNSPPDVLELNDVLAEIGNDARVVRLFDRAAMPTPGQLKDRIDSHLGEGSAATPPDASQALSDALAELKRSLR